MKTKQFTQYLNLRVKVVYDPECQDYNSAAKKVNSLEFVKCLLGPVCEGVEVTEVKIVTI